MLKCDIDLSGQIFGNLTVITRTSKYKWLCKCSCGKCLDVRCYALIDGHTKSCGHTRNDNFNYTKHADSKLRLYQCYHSMIARCETREEYIKNNIHVCEEWLNDYLSFKEWALSNGYQDNLTLERIDVYQNYCPENCIWATRAVQADNKTNTIYLSYNGETKTLTQWAKSLNVSRHMLYMRKYRGLSDEDVLKDLVK